MRLELVPKLFDPSDAFIPICFIFNTTLRLIHSSAFFRYTLYPVVLENAEYFSSILLERLIT